MVLLCAIGGYLIGLTISSNMPMLSFLGQEFIVGLQNPLIIDLKVLMLNFALSLHLNIMSIVGLIFGSLIVRD